MRKLLFAVLSVPLVVFAASTTTLTGPQSRHVFYLAPEVTNCTTNTNIMQTSIATTAANMRVIVRWEAIIDGYSRVQVQYGAGAAPTTWTTLQQWPSTQAVAAGSSTLWIGLMSGTVLSPLLGAQGTYSFRLVKSYALPGSDPDCYNRVLELIQIAP